MTNFFCFFTVLTVLASSLSAFGLGGPECRGFGKTTENYFALFYKTQNDDGSAVCKEDADCILSARGPCNRQELASKLKVSKKNAKKLLQASKRYETLFEKCSVEVCDKTRRRASATKCTDGRCEFIYEY